MGRHRGNTEASSVQWLANEDALTFAVLWLRVHSGMAGRRFLDLADFEPEAAASDLALRLPIAFNGMSRQQSLNTYQGCFGREAVALHFVSIARKSVAFDLKPSTARTADEGSTLSWHCRVEPEPNPSEIYLAE